MVDLSLEFCGVKFPNPFTLAAAPTTDSAEMVARAFEAGWGGAILKTTSVETEEVSLVYPMMSGIDLEDKKLMGLQNIDLISERHIDEVEKDVKALKKEFPDKVVAASIMGSKKEEARISQTPGSCRSRLWGAASLLRHAWAAWVPRSDRTDLQTHSPLGKETATRVPVS